MIQPRRSEERVKGEPKPFLPGAKQVAIAYLTDAAGDIYVVEVHLEIGLHRCDVVQHSVRNLTVGRRRRAG